MGKMKQLLLEQQGKEFENGFGLGMKLSPFEQVGEFHRTYGHPNYRPGTENSVPNAKLVRLRLKLITEELMELFSGILAEGDIRRTISLVMILLDKAIDRITDNDIDFNLIEIADALGDINYVVNGAAHAFNFDLDAVTAEIHRSNMSKLGPNGEVIRNDAGKILKGPNYFEPRLDLVLNINKENNNDKSN